MKYGNLSPGKMFRVSCRGKALFQKTAFCDSEGQAISACNSDSRLYSFREDQIVEEIFYQNLQDEWVASRGYKAGQQFVVTRKPLCGELGYELWHSAIDKYIGMSMKSERFQPGGVTFHDCPYLIPFFVLEEHCCTPRLRPYNSEELADLVGKVIADKTSNHRTLVVEYRGGPQVEAIRLGALTSIHTESLLANYTIDGKPCGVEE